MGLLAKSYRRLLAYGMLYLLQLLSMAQVLHAQEAIERITSLVDLLETGEVKISEIIEISGQGEDFKFGIRRELPASISTPTGGTKNLEYKISACMLNKVFMRCSIAKVDNAIFAQLGDEGVILPNEKPTRIFEYVLEISGAIIQFADHKSFSWNFTLDYFEEPIKAVDISFRAFDMASSALAFKNTRAWLADKGKKEFDLPINRLPENAARLNYSKAILPGQHIHAALEW